MGHRAQQGPQGHRGEVALHAGPQRGLRARAGTATACPSSTRSTRSSASTQAERRRAAAPWIRWRSAAAAASTRSEFIDIQREEFQRLGVFGDWEHPYLTLAPAYEATIVREFGRFVGRGLVYKGLKPVHWCMHCKTALAQAEVEYEDQTHAVGLREVPASDALPRRSPARSAAGRSRSSSGRPRRGRCRPTSPSRCTRARRTPRSSVGRRGARRRPAAARGAFLRLPGVKGARAPRRRSRCRGRRSRASVARHPWIDRDVPGARRRTSWRWTRAPAWSTSRPATARRTTSSAARSGSRSTTRWTTTGASSPRSRTSRARRSGRRTRRSSSTSARRGALVGRGPARRTPTRTAGAARTRRSSAPPSSGSSRWTRHGAPRSGRSTRSERA